MHLISHIVTICIWIETLIFSLSIYIYVCMYVYLAIYVLLGTWVASAFDYYEYFYRCRYILFLWVCTFTSFGCKIRNGISGFYGNSIFNFFRSCHTISVVTEPLYFSPRSVQGSYFFTSSTWFLFFFFFFNCSHLTGYVIVSQCGTDLLVLNN